ncbi:MAG TPA: hypothetical protein PK095_04660 [Myxococcota bacterium]|nr:hypothetical protein [Myxococcota bacterium]
MVTTERRFAQLFFVVVLVMAVPAFARLIMVAAEAYDEVTWLIVRAFEVGSQLAFSALGLAFSLRVGSTLGRVGAILGLTVGLLLLPVEGLDDLGWTLRHLLLLVGSVGRFLVALVLLRRYPNGLTWTGVILLGLELGWALLVTVTMLAGPDAYLHDVDAIFVITIAIEGAGPILLVLGARKGLAEADPRPGGDLSEAADGLALYRLGLVIGLASGILGQLLILAIGRDRGALAIVALLTLAGTITSQVLMLVGLTRFQRLPGATSARSLATATWVLVLVLTAVAGLMVLLQLVALGDRSTAHDLARGMGALGGLLPGLFAQLFLFLALERLARHLGRDDLARRALMMVGWAGGLSLFTLVAQLARGDRDLLAVVVMSGLFALGFFVTLLVFVFLTLPPLERQMRAGLSRSPLARPSDAPTGPTSPASPTSVAPAPREERSPFARPLDPPT